MRLNLFGRHARHDFAEGRETVAEMIARIDAMDVAPEYAHRVAAEEYPTGKIPVYALTQLEQRADGGRPLHDLDHVQRYCAHADSLHGRCADCGASWSEQATAMGGAR